MSAAQLAVCPALCDLLHCFPGGSVVKSSPANAGDSGDLRAIPGSGRSPGQEDPLEEEVKTHSSIFTWELPWTEEPGGLQSHCACAQSCLTLCDPTDWGELPFPVSRGSS